MRSDFLSEEAVGFLECHLGWESRPWHNSNHFADLTHSQLTEEDDTLDDSFLYYMMLSNAMGSNAATANASPSP